MRHPIAVLVICDGARPDFVSDETTPNMAALRRAGAWAADHRAIFPSATRASSASIATGCHPGAHGLRGNAVALPAEGGFALHDAGKPEFFDVYRSHFGRGLMRPALAERVAGLHGAIIGANVSPGAAFFHDGGSHAHMIHRHMCYAPGRQPIAPVEAAPGIAGDTAVTDRFLGMLTERLPSVATLWLSEPDVSMHAAPLGGALHLDALAQADALVGRVAEVVERLRDAGHDVLFMVGSDHGHESVSEAIPVERLLFEAGFKSAPDGADLIVAPQGGSAFIHFAGRALDRRRDAAAWLGEQDWVQDVFMGEDLAALGQIPGADLIAIDMAKSSDSNVNGVPGLSALATRHSQDEEALRRGCGVHGGRGAFESRPMLIATGDGFEAGKVISAPTSITDIAPSILAHLGLEAPDPDGRGLQGR
jgi:arylsulfatase A-like enzyme